MRSTERAQTWFGMADGEAEDGDEKAGPVAVARTWSAGASDDAMARFERYADGGIPEAPTRAMGLAGVRLEEVMRLRVALASGCYRVSAAELADKMIASISSSREWRRRN